MALKIKIKHKGKFVEGYLKIISVKTGSGPQSGANFGVSPISTNNPNAKIDEPKFQTIIEYTVEKDIKGEKEYSQGIFHVPYDLGSKENILEFGYNKLKKMFKEHKKQTVIDA